MTEEEYQTDLLKHRELEEKARKFVDSNQGKLEQPMTIEAQSSAQTQLDNETLDTLKQLRETSLSCGNQIDT